MFTILIALLDGFSRFQSWFDQRFGWFFTNGMKQGRPQRAGSLRA
jgi:hypothetical protein